MADIDLTAYKPSPGTTGDANQIANAFTLIQAAVNDIEEGQFATGKIFSLSKLKQDGATTGQGMYWDGATWVHGNPRTNPTDTTKVLRGDGTFSGPTDLDYAEKSTSVAISGLTEGTADTILDGNSVTYDGGRVEICFYAPGATGSTNGSITYVVLRDGNVVEQVGPNPIRSGAVNIASAQSWSVFDTPAPGLHTYKIHAFCSAATQTLAADVGGSGKVGKIKMRVKRA